MYVISNFHSVYLAIWLQLQYIRTYTTIATNPRD